MVLLTVTDYPDADDAYRAGMAAQVAPLEGWWGDAGLEERRFTTVATPIRTRADVDNFLAIQRLGAAEAGDVSWSIYLRARRPGCLWKALFVLPDGAAGGDVQSAIETAQLVKLIPRRRPNTPSCS